MRLKPKKKFFHELAAFALFASFVAFNDSPPSPSPSRHLATGRGLTRESEVCADGRQKYWAQDAVDSEFMKLKADELAGSPSSPVRVAVVDSGLDRSQLSEFSTVGEIRLRAGVLPNDVDPITGKIPERAENPEPIGDPGYDDGGHGTMVSSVIAGADRLGSARGISLSVYRPNASGDSSGSASRTDLDIATYKACQENADPDGITLVNRSWGSRSHESGMQVDPLRPPMEEKLLKKYAEMGCLVISSAGNSSFRKKQENQAGWKLDDAMIYTEATDWFRDPSPFSSRGEIAAPGSAIYVIESTAARSKHSSENRCEPFDPAHPKRFVNGTSFASPMLTAVASQAVRVLKAGSKFKKLSNPDRVRLVNRLLKASVINGNVNGLRAVSLAEIWNLDPAPAPQRLAMPETDGVNAFVKALEKSGVPFCSEPVEVCLKPADDHTLRACDDLGRKQLALCQEPNPRLMAALTRSLFEQDRIEEGFRFAHYLRASASPFFTIDLEEQVLQSYLRSMGYSRFGSNPDFAGKMSRNFIQGYLPHYFLNCSITHACRAGLVEDLLKEVLQSSEVEATLKEGVDPKTGEDRGSGAILRSVTDTLTIGRKILGDDRVSEVLDTYIGNFSSEIGPDHTADGIMGHSLVVPTRILGELVSPLLQSAKSNAFDQAFLKRLKRNEVRVLKESVPRNGYYGTTTETKAGSFFSEIFPTRSLFDAMIARNPEPIDSIVRSEAFEKLGPLQTHYLLKHVAESSLWSSKKTEIALGILDSLLKKRGWGVRNDPELLTSALVLLAEPVQTQEAGVIQHRLQLIFNEALHGSLVLTVFNGVVYRQALGTQGLTFDQHPFLGDLAMKSLARKMIYALMNIRPGQLNDLPPLLSLNIGNAMKKIILEEGNPGPIAALVTHIETSRLSANPPVAQLIPSVSTSQLVDQLASQLLAWIQDRKTEALATPLFEDLINIYNKELANDAEVLKFVSAFPKTGTWHQEALKMIAQEDRKPGTFQAGLIPILKKFISRVDR